VPVDDVVSVTDATGATIKGELAAPTDDTVRVNIEANSQLRGRLSPPHSVAATGFPADRCPDSVPQSVPLRDTIGSPWIQTSALA
jgi:hypothetical protein